MSSVVYEHFFFFREQFNELTPPQKVRSVARTLEQMILELPIFLLRLEEVTAALDEKLEWREFKFCFKVGTSKVVSQLTPLCLSLLIAWFIVFQSGVLEKLVSHKDTLKDIMMQVCELVQRDAFTQSLQSLGLLDLNAAPTYSSECQKMPKSSSFTVPKQHQHGYKV